jgi:hypothetical protein
MTTEVEAEAFEDIVSGVLPESHYQCFLCYPEDHPEPKAICGVRLLGVDPEPGAEMCGECDETVRLHMAEHHLRWNG